MNSRGALAVEHARGATAAESAVPRHTLPLPFCVPTTPLLDKHDLYELCVTDGPRLARFLRAVHGHKPSVLREDFSGTAALARAWAATGSSAIAVDIDPLVLARAQAPGIKTVVSDAVRCRLKADIIAATNFPLGYFHSRDALVAYLKAAHRSLAPRGIFAADLYGGADSFRSLKLTQKRRGPAGERITYTWEQRHADPVSGLVLDTLSFSVTKGSRTRKHPDAFVYRWRLWAIPELKDALADAGFQPALVYARLGDAIDSDGNLYVLPLKHGHDLDDNYVVYVVARR